MIRCFSKQICLLFVFFSYILLGMTSFLSSDEPEQDKIHQFTLKNGMKVILKKTKFDTNEILLRMTAKGGYASLPSSVRVNGRLAANIAVESGFQDISSDKFYAEDIDLAFEVFAYCRNFDGVSSSEKIDVLLKYIQKIFTQHRLTEDGLTKVLKETKHHLQKDVADHDVLFQNVFLATNTQNFSHLQPLTLRELEAIDLVSCQEIFNSYVANPADFTLVIVGDFDLKTLVPLIESSLGTITKKQSLFNFYIAPEPMFPKKHLEHPISAFGEHNSFARITFPFNKSLDKQSLKAIKLTAYLIQMRISEKLKDVFRKDFGVDIFHEIPIYPQLSLHWLVIQFRSHVSLVSDIQACIVDTLQSMYKKGISPQELIEVKRQFQQQDEFWLRDNEFWVSMLSDYSLWGWEIAPTSGTYCEIASVTLEEVRQIMESSIHNTNFTFIYTEPEKAHEVFNIFLNDD
jgi:zinc protease